MHEYYDVRKIIIVVDDVSESGDLEFHTQTLNGRTHVRYTIASRPLFLGTVYFAFGSSTTYRIRSQPVRFSEIQSVLSFFILATMNAFDAGVCGMGVLSLDQEALKTRPMTTNNPNPSKTRRKLRRRESVKMAISSLMTIVGPKRHEGDE
jgi:hypothetical protein